MDDQEYVIVLVHGTILPLTRRAKWVEQSSPFCKHLYDELPGAHIYDFLWSGKNKAHARTTAANDLAIKLEKYRSEFHPRAMYVLIAHSHGGNVALDVAGRRIATGKLAGVACLSTPFINPGPRRWRPLGSFSAWLLTTLLAALLLDVGQRLALVVDRTPEVKFIQALAVGSIAYGAIRLMRKLAQTKADSTVAHLRPPPKEDLVCPVLILRSFGDEASAAMSFAQFMSWLLTLFAQSTVRFSRKIVWPTAFVMSSLLLSWLASKVIGGTVARLSRLILEKSADAVPYVASIAGLATLGLAAATLVMAIMYGSFGWDAALVSLFYDLSVEATPPGEWKVHQLEVQARSSVDSHDEGMRHARMYEDPRALTILVEWLKQLHASTTS